MARTCLFILLLTITIGAIAQKSAPAWTIVNDSATHTTVLHKSIDEIIKVRNAFGQKGMFEIISPDIKLKNGIIDHKGPTGNIDVREHYYNGKLIGYIQYDGSNKEREIYYNTKGQITLEKRYDKGVQTFIDTKVRPASDLLIPIKITNDNSSR